MMAVTMAMAGSYVGLVNAGGVTVNTDGGRGWLLREAEPLPRPPSCGLENIRSHCRRDPGEKSGNAVARTNVAPVPLHRDISNKGKGNIPNFCLPVVEIEVGIMTELATSSLVGGGALF
jgi:hypothetical protein